MALQRCSVVYNGSVQGVGFRFAACRLAGQFAVTGYVRNNPEGAVELVVEGEREEIDRFLTAVRREMAHFIRSATQQTSAHQNEFRSFGVRY